MQLLNISHPDTLGLATAEIHERPLLVQFPNVFVLLAAPTANGARQLDDMKMRRPGKNYGTAIGSLHAFVEGSDKSALPTPFRSVPSFRPLRGAFIRLPFRAPGFQSPVIRDGSHQGLLLGGSYNRLFRAIEASFREYPPDDIWNGRNYCAPLCTSCNISGHPDGSIVAFEKALAFARERGVGHFITTSKPASELGSYPIFGFSRDKVAIHRDGPGLEKFKACIPAELRGW